MIVGGVEDEPTEPACVVESSGVKHPDGSDLSNAEWKILEPLLPSEKPGGRHRGYAVREIVNAIEYLIRCGGAWRSLPHDFPHWQSVYHYFRLWKRDGTWLRIHDHLHEEVRKQMGRDLQPSAAIIDSQSVKTTEKGGFMATMGRRRSMAENAIFWLIPLVF
jgi:transposase